MDQETKDYLDRKLFILVKKEDVEKLRQETKANFRQLKEENKTQIVEGIREIKSDLEGRFKEGKEALDAIQTNLREKQPLLDQWNQSLLSSFEQLKAEIESMLDQSKQEQARNLERMREEETAWRTLSKEEWKEEIDRMASSLHGRIKEELTEIKEEIGSMMRFSFADLEKKIGALEARIKALEKMVFH